jgi:hypothetical protein
MKPFIPAKIIMKPFNYQNESVHTIFMLLICKIFPKILIVKVFKSLIKPCSECMPICDRRELLAIQSSEDYGNGIQT